MPSLQNLAGYRPITAVKDYADLHAAITAAGANGVLVFEPGQTYTITKSAKPLAGQIWLGNGATIKRADEITTTTTTNIGTGSSPTVLTVADETGFEIGMTITVVNGSSYDAANHEITAVSSGSITVVTNFSTAFASGGTVVRSFETVRSDVAGFRVDSLTIDGNRSNNATLEKWEIHHELYFGGDDNLAADCEIKEAQGEGVMIQADNCVLERCKIYDINGNGVHFSGCTRTAVSLCHIYNNNELSGVGHEDGGISFSRAVADTTIDRCHIHNCKAGIGGIDLSDNSDVKIVNCVIGDNTNESIEAVFYSGSSPSTENFLISGNTLRDPVVINNTAGTGNTGPNQFMIIGNRFEGVNLELRHVFGFTVANNMIDLTGDSGTIAVYNIGCDECAFAGNIIIGGGYATYLTGAAARNLYQGNQFINQVNSAVGSDSSTAGQHNVLADNYITNDSTATTSYYGILLYGGNIARGNVIEIDKGNSGIYVQDGATYSPIVQGNTVYAGAASNTIRADGGTSGIVIIDNQVDAAISNGGGGSNTARNNDVVT